MIRETVSNIISPFEGCGNVAFSVCSFVSMFFIFLNVQWGYSAAVCISQLCVWQ